jgi:hypothetical protein
VVAPEAAALSPSAHICRNPLGDPFTSLFVEPVHPARQHTNLRTVVEGPPIVVSAAHAKIRRDGYRRSRGQ